YDLINGSAAHRADLAKCVIFPLAANATEALRHGNVEIAGRVAAAALADLQGFQDRPFPAILQQPDCGRQPADAAADDGDLYFQVFINGGITPAFKAREVPDGSHLHVLLWHMRRRAVIRLEHTGKSVAGSGKRSAVGWLIPYSLKR